jgi:hypothetical protein
LSTFPGPEWFKNVILVSSSEDLYAPFDSARIQVCHQATYDKYQGEIYIEMAKNILDKLPVECLYRVDVNFMITEKTMDSFIGRTAHIQFLENEFFMKQLVYRFMEFLK